MSEDVKLHINLNKETFDRMLSEYYAFSIDIWKLYTNHFKRMKSRKMVRRLKNASKLQ